MHWHKEDVENFFGARFTLHDPMLEMRFTAGGIRYRLYLSEQSGTMFLTGDVHNPDCAFPAIEIDCDCGCIAESEALGVGPVLLFYATAEEQREHLRLCVTRDGNGRFSFSPHWARISPD
jgi:hypothetical protein